MSRKQPVPYPYKAGEKITRPPPPPTPPKPACRCCNCGCCGYQPYFVEGEPNPPPKKP